MKKLKQRSKWNRINRTIKIRKMKKTEKKSDKK